MKPTSRAHRLASFLLLIALIVGIFPPVEVVAGAALPPSMRAADALFPHSPDSLVEPFTDPVRAALEAAMGPDVDLLTRASRTPSLLEPLGLPAPAAPTVARPTPPNPRVPPGT